MSLEKKILQKLQARFLVGNRNKSCITLQKSRGFSGFHERNCPKSIFLKTTIGKQAKLRHLFKTHPVRSDKISLNNLQKMNFIQTIFLIVQ